MSRRAEHLFSIIGQVDDAFIDEAACPRRLPRPQRQWTKWAALCAACLLLAVGLWRITPLWPAADGNANGAAPPSNEGSSGGAGPEYSGSDGAAPGEEPPGDAEPPSGEGAPPEQGELPVLSIRGPFTGEEGSMGLLAFAGPDPRQAVRDYLSDAITLPDGTDTLSVYRSTVERYDSGTPVSSDEVAMETLLDDVLARLGLTQADCEVTRTTSEGWDASGQENISLVYLEAAAPNGMAIKIHYDLTYRVYLPSSALPQDFPLSSDTTTPEGALEQGQAIIRLLGALLDMDEPVCRLTGGGVNMDGEPNGYYITISQGTDPLARPTSPAVTTWGCNPESQGLWLNFDPKLTQELLGDYPIISMDQARDEILAGEWSADGTVSTEEDIYRSELVYCSDLGGLTMPYYCFYLYKGTFNGGMHEIECRYVPAVERQYLDLSSYSGPLGNT